MKNKKLKGYIFSRSFMGERVPQHVQNIVLRDYCKKNNYLFLMSATEYSIRESDLMLFQTLNEMKKFDGIIFYSLFQLPENIKQRKKVYNIIKKNKKEIHFSLEQMKMINKNDLEKIEEIWKIKKILPFCPTYI